MSNQKLKQKTEEIIKILRKIYPKAKIALNFKTPIELLVATILSAQCTDKRVNIITNYLFKKYRTVLDYAQADLSQFENEIYSAGFFRNKAKNIIAAARMINQKFYGKIPGSMDELIQLPGVARKTANIILFNYFSKQSGIAVDTHVQRLSQRLGLTSWNNPEKIEIDLMSLVPKKGWGKFSYLLIEHGRKVCLARKPRCNLCVAKKYCDYYNSY